MPLMVTSFLLLVLSMQLTPQKIDPYISAKDFHNEDESFLNFHLGNGDKPISSSSSDSSSSTSSSESDISAEPGGKTGKLPYDVLALIVVDDRRYAHGRRGKLLEPYRSLNLQLPEKPNQQRQDEANALSKLRNTNLVKNQPVIRKGEPKELYQIIAKPSASHSEPLPASHNEPPKVFQNNLDLDELLSMKNEDAVAPLPNTKALPLNHKGSAKDAKQTKGIPPNRDKDIPEKEKTYTMSRDQLIALRARWSKTCDKAAAKECKKACKQALKSACEDYDCKHKIKKSFKRACKRHCNGRFIPDGGGSGSDSSGSSD